MDFRGKKFNYVEIAIANESNRGVFTTLSETEKLVWNSNYENDAIWKSMYSYCDVNHREVMFGSYYFESDIENFELNKEITIASANYFNINYDIPFDAMKFKITNRSIWTEIIPSVMGIKPSYYLNEVFKEITKELNTYIKNRFNILNAFDLQVYSPRQLSRVTGSYLPKSKRYVIELNYFELKNYTKKQIYSRAKWKKKLIFPNNNDFFISKEAEKMFMCYRKKIYNQHKDYKKTNIRIVSRERPCITSMKKNGVVKGKRNIALFYATINAKEQNISHNIWNKNCKNFMKNFENYKDVPLSQIKATTKSGYKKKYYFSCKKIREVFPEHCNCKNCPYNKCNNDNIKIYRKEIKYLLDNNGTKSMYKELFLYHYDKKININNINNYRNLKKSKIFDCIDDLQSGSFIQIPVSFKNKIENLGTELILLFTMLYCSNLGYVLNPKMELKHYAKKTGKSIRTIQRQYKTLKEKGFILKNKYIVLEKRRKKEEQNNPSNKNTKTNNVISIVPLLHYYNQVKKLQNKNMEILCKTGST